MSNTVTITGRIATTTLDRGETVTVERTDRIDSLIEKGYVTVSEPDTLVGAAYPAEAAEAASGAAGGPGEAADEEPTPPGRNASRAEWVAFLDGQGLKVDDDMTRDDLVEVWRG